jgi:GAF domain-containing protein
MTLSEARNASTSKSTDDELRLEAIESLKFMYKDSDKNFEHITELAKNIFNAPIALITLLDDTHQHYLSESGLNQDQTKLEDSFCQYALDNAPGEVLAVPNAKEDKRFQNLPSVTSEPQVRSYLGAPIVSLHDHVLGTFCVLDTKPQTFSEVEKNNIRNLAEEVSIRLQQRERQLEIQEDTLIEQKKLRYLDELITQIPALVLVTDKELNSLISAPLIRKPTIVFP